MKRYLCILLLLCAPSLADPCGMVPPISLDGDTSTIVRVGEQNTYVFFKDGLETVVIHPGYRGDVDEFGMLIPFPAVPALRKIPDETFAQLKMAVDPPTITYWLDNDRYDDGPSSRAGMVLESAAPSPARDEVVVLKEEAVGMYEVVVLEAGSAAALKRWMDQHHYRFPDGMESACEDYVKEKWCFVAVKTRVGSKKGIDPQPGMRGANTKKPKDAVFTGTVQAMGFRFYSKELVVPMRLSTFNEGGTDNTMYVLADQPLRASNLPLDFVKRQLTGEKLYQNLTAPLAYQIQGGSDDDMSPNDWKQLESQRDPVPYNGIAAELFASDLLADDLGQLTHSFEEKEKALLDIGERLGLRGGGLDAMHAAVLLADRQEVKAQALDLVKGMTLTVIEGEFPAEIIAQQNIRFAPYTRDDIEGTVAQSPKAGEAVFGGSSDPETVALSGLNTTDDWIRLLEDPDQRQLALAELATKGRAALPSLLANYRNEAAPIVGRGYCLALLSKTPDDELRAAVRQVADSANTPLIGIWSRAALIDMCATPKDLLILLDQEYAQKHADPDLVSASSAFPLRAELQRPVALKLQQWGSRLTLEQQLRFLGVAEQSGAAVNVTPNIQAVIAPALKSAKITELTNLMYHSEGQEVRRLSAAVLAGLTGEKRHSAFASVMEGLQLSGSVTKVPWAGGALFLPQFSAMTKAESRELITGLTRWSVWTDLHKTDSAQVQPLENNLRSYSLWTTAGGNESWRNAHGGQQWFTAYRELMGSKAALALLAEQKVPKGSVYWTLAR